MKHTGNILWVFGIFTIIMGVVFTSYLGDFFQRIGVAIPVIIDPMRQVMLALSIAVGIGVIHIIIGLVMGFIENVKLGKFLSALSTQGVWILFMIGIGILFLSINVGLTLIFVAIILEMFFKFKDGGIMASVLSVFGFSGFIGDIFSYARLMALGVGTAGIALAVNFLTLMSAESIPVIGIVIAILIFVVGHTFNMAMNGLGAFIHAVRLHFLEFFQKFYDGGGFSYAPFKAKREKTYIQN